MMAQELELLFFKGCPTGALGYEGGDIYLDEIEKEILADIDFYDEFGGGITISGKKFQ